MDFRFNREDISQVIMGAFALSVPIAFTEEAWALGESLPLANLATVVLISLLFMASFTYFSIFSGNIEGRPVRFATRVLLGYAISLGVVCLVLFALNRFPLLSEPMTALKRCLLIGMPASMGAFIVDSLDKESFHSAKDSAAADDSHR